MARNFSVYDRLPIAFNPQETAISFCDPAPKAGASQVTMAVDWSRYAAAYPGGIGLELDFALGVSNRMTRIRSIRIDNTQNYSDVYVEIPDTLQVVFVPANSVVVENLGSGGAKAVVYLPGASLSQTRITVYNVPQQPVFYIAPPLPSANYLGSVARNVGGLTDQWSTTDTSNIQIPLGPSYSGRLILIMITAMRWSQLNVDAVNSIRIGPSSGGLGKAVLAKLTIANYVDLGVYNNDTPLAITTQYGNSAAAGTVCFAGMYLYSPPENLTEAFLDSITPLTFAPLTYPEAGFLVSTFAIYNARNRYFSQAYSGGAYNATTAQNPILQYTSLANSLSFACGLGFSTLAPIGARTIYSGRFVNTTGIQELGNMYKVNPIIPATTWAPAHLYGFSNESMIRPIGFRTIAGGKTPFFNGGALVQASII
jgi:hypothetical protein